MAVTGALPYDLTHLTGGGARVLWAQSSSPAPEEPKDVFSPIYPYTAVVANGWKDFGATNDKLTITRDMNDQGWEIQQASGAVLREIDEVNRQIEGSFAELSPSLLQMIEEANAIETIAAVPGTQRQIKRVKFGQITELSRYKLAVVVRRKKASGQVTEPGGRTRGCFVSYVAHAAEFSADNVDVEFEKGNLTGAGIKFDLFPDSSRSEGTEFGSWLVEEAGTI